MNYKDSKLFDLYYSVLEKLDKNYFNKFNSKNDLFDLLTHLLKYYFAHKNSRWKIMRDLEISRNLKDYEKEFEFILNDLPYQFLKEAVHKYKLRYRGKLDKTKKKK